MNYNNICYRCFCEKPIAEKPCPKCGYKHTPDTVPKNCLLPGTLLHGRYIVGIALGVGGFGITYKCLDTKIGGICAIKEYFPANFALRTTATKLVSVAEQNVEKYNKVMRRFVEEAELVKSLHHRNVITIYDNFFENNTAYYVMEYCDGIDLRRYTNNFSRKLEYDEGMNIMYQVMSGLEYIHSKGILHRDIAPDNIYITKNNSIKILDFGSARSEMDQFNRELSVIVKVGYAPIEQYGGRGKQGPYTDIYALGATFYHLFTSKIPLESTQRVADDTLTEFSRLRPDLPDNLKYCIEKAMELTTARRISSIAEMKNILGIGNGGDVSSGFVNNNSYEKNEQMRHMYVTQSDKVKRNNSYNIPKRASIGKRIAAYMIDLALWEIIYCSVLLGVFGTTDISIGISVLFPIVFTIINTVMEMAASATVGKALLRLYVCSRTGDEAMPIQILIRNIIKNLGVFLIVFEKGEDLLDDRATDSIVCVKN